VSKKNKNVEKKQETEALKAKMNEPWIQMKTGLRIIAITSLGMAILTAYQAITEFGKSIFIGILYGLFFGALIWVIFFVFYFFRRSIVKK
jgi:ABC-type proline/glycine betaine transport system permease subunit